MRKLLFVVAALTVASCATAKVNAPAPPAPAAAAAPLRTPDVIWVPTQDPVVAAMLRLARVTKNDVVYDLGCGDGKIVIAAAKMGARGVGVDIDPKRVQEANAAVKVAGVGDRVRIIHGDIFDPAIKISEASVVTLYLLPSLNVKLMPRLKSELKPGTRVVSNSFDMGDTWPPERTETVGSYTVYYWTIPKR